MKQVVLQTIDNAILQSEADIGDDSAGLMEGEGEGEEEALLEGKGAVGLAVKVAEEEKSDSEKGVVYLREDTLNICCWNVRCKNKMTL